MDETDLAELRRLRARAYSADADIDADPTALSRLRELEERARASRDGDLSLAPSREHASSRRSEQAEVAPQGDEAIQIGIRPAIQTEAQTVAQTEPDEPSASQSVSRSAARRRRRRVRIVAWATSLVVVAGIAVTATAGVLAALPRALPQGYDVQSVGSLEVDPDFDASIAFGERDSAPIGYELFHGLRPVSTVDLWTTDGETRTCLLVMVLEDGGSGAPSDYRGPFYSGCGAGRFPAIVQVEVGDQLPAELRELYADGTGLQFVLVDEVVHVYTD